MSDTAHHWDDVYRNKAADALSWYQAHPDSSLAFIADSQVPRDAPLIDVGGGASTLVDHLLGLHYTDVSVLDISPHGLAQAQARLGPMQTRQVQWIVQDVTQFRPPQAYVLWHDRAVLHFLTDNATRSAYVAAVRRSVAPGGTVIVATFAPDGPTACSGLDVVRYDADALCALFGADFEHKADTRELHRTPWGSSQSFTYLRLCRRGD